MGLLRSRRLGYYISSKGLLNQLQISAKNILSFFTRTLVNKPQVAYA